MRAGTAHQAAEEARSSFPNLLAKSEIIGAIVLYAVSSISTRFSSNCRSTQAYAAHLQIPPSPKHPASQLTEFPVWQSRQVYSAALEQRITICLETGKGLNYRAQWVRFRDQCRVHLPQIFRHTVKEISDIEPRILPGISTPA